MLNFRVESSLEKDLESFIHQDIQSQTLNGTGIIYLLIYHKQLAM